MPNGHANTCVTPQDCWCEVRNLSKVFLVTIGILAAEIVGGFWSESLALLSDAGHVFGDSAAITVGMVVATLSRFNFNSKRAVEIGFYINITLLVIICGWILYEAWGRYQNPHEIIAPIMLVVAFAGGVGNFFQHTLLERMADEHKHALHRTISAHVLYDMCQSAGVIVGGFIILFTGWRPADLLVSVGIVLLIVFQLPKLVRNANRPKIDLHSGHDHD